MESAETPVSLDPRCVLLDVRPLLRSGQDPFQTILAAVKGLAPGQGLAVRALFEPRPLLAVLGAKGFRGQSRQLGADDWVVEFLPEAGALAQTLPTDAGAVPKLDVESELDVRGLEPPEPLLRILAAARSLAPGATLTVLHERRPALLYPKLEELGLGHRTEELGEDLFRIHVTRPAGGA
jgi:uncharacterized protein (DUF2249 family)